MLAETGNPQHALSIRTRTNAESRRQFLVTWSVKSLRHDVRQHHRSLAILNLDFTALDLITNVVVLDVDVLGASMVDRVLGHLDAGLVVFIDHERRFFFTGNRQDLTKQTVNSLALLDC